MILGFTGTQHGMKSAQIITLKQVLRSLEPTEVHHGLCIGADAQFHALVRLLFEKKVRVVGHPCSIRGKQARWFYEDCEVLMPVKPPLERNRNIVNACERLVAAPFEPMEQLRSGTWSTIRRATEAERPITRINPDGTLA